MVPAEVRKLTPTEAASILGLDRTEALIAVPLLDGDFVDTGGMVPEELLVPVGSKAGGQRLRRVV